MRWCLLALHYNTHTPSSLRVSTRTQLLKARVKPRVAPLRLFREMARTKRKHRERLMGALSCHLRRERENILDVVRSALGRLGLDPAAGQRI